LGGLVSFNSDLCNFLFDFAESLVEVGWPHEGGVPINHLSTVLVAEVDCVVVVVAVDFGDLVFGVPLDALAVFPEAVLDFLLLHHQVDPQPVLLPSEPEPLVLPPIRPLINSESVLLVVLVHAFVPATVIPDVNPKPLHVVVAPLALELPPVQPLVDPCPRDPILLPLP